MMKFVYRELSNCTETVYCSPVVVGGKDGDGLHFEKFSLDFSKFTYPFLRQSKNVPWIALLAKK